MFHFFIKDKKYYQVLLSLAIPAAAVNLISFAVTLGDSLMLGKLGETAMSAANLANQLWFMVMIVDFGTISGSMVFASQYYGKGDLYSFKRIVSIMLYISAAISIIASCIALFIPEIFMSWYTKDEEVIRLGAQYLRWVGICYPFYAITNAFVSVLRSAHITRIAIIIYLISLVVNLTGNYIFIFGNFGAPRMEVAGAALATALARISEFVTLLVYLIFFERKICYRISDLFVPMGKYIKAFVVTSLPVVFNETMWGFGVTCISMVIGHISTDFVAANSIAHIAWQAVYAFVSGLGNATAVMIGNAVGSGEPKEKIMNKAKTMIVIATGTGTACGLIMIATRSLLLSFYEITENTRNIALGLIAVYAFILVFEAISLHLIVGILRGGGDTKYAAFLDVTFLWVISLPVGLFVGFVLKAEPPIVYASLKIDVLIKAALGIRRMMSGKWIHDVTVSPSGK